jgi:hypothetical protein
MANEQPMRSVEDPIFGQDLQLIKVTSDLRNIITFFITIIFLIRIPNKWYNELITRNQILLCEHGMAGIDKII